MSSYSMPGSVNCSEFGANSIGRGSTVLLFDGKSLNEFVSDFFFCRGAFCFDHKLSNALIFINDTEFHFFKRKSTCTCKLASFLIEFQISTTSFWQSCFFFFWICRWIGFKQRREFFIFVHFCEQLTEKWLKSHDCVSWTSNQKFLPVGGSGDGHVTMHFCEPLSPLSHSVTLSLPPLPPLQRVT